jgi:hypothetical protein
MIMNDSTYDHFTLTRHEKDDPRLKQYLQPPTEEDQATFVATLQLLQGDNALQIEELDGQLAWSSSLLTAEDFSFLESLGLRGKLIASGCCQPEEPYNSRTLIVAQERIKEAVDLPLPNNCRIVYYQVGDKWQKFPIDAPVLQKRIRLTVSQDKRSLFNMWVEADLFSGAGGGGGLFDWRTWPGIS